MSLVLCTYQLCNNISKENNYGMVLWFALIWFQLGRPTECNKCCRIIENTAMIKLIVINNRNHKQVTVP